LFPTSWALIPRRALARVTAALQDLAVEASSHLLKVFGAFIETSMGVISAHTRWRQKNLKFKASLGYLYLERLSQKVKKKIEGLRGS
jgi:hypothetical protein